MVSGGTGLGTPMVWILSPCFDLPPYALPHTHSNVGDLFFQGSLWDIFVQTLVNDAFVNFNLLAPSCALISCKFWIWVEFTVKLSQLAVQTQWDRAPSWFPRGPILASKCEEFSMVSQDVTDHPAISILQREGLQGHRLW